MRYELISKDKPLFKANLHCHSTCSDGRCTPEELKAAYKSRGYSILAITDHEYLLDHSDLNDENFLTITGYEISVNELSDQPNQFRRTCHLNLLAKEPHNTKHVCFHPQYIWCGDKSLIPGLEYIGGLYERDYSPECVNDIIKTAKENGFLVSYNHPHWSLETNGECLRYEGMYAMEIYNHGCYQMGISEYNAQVYDAMLRMGKRIFCVATDDNHDIRPFEHPLNDSFGGFTMIQAQRLDYPSVISALELGTFYASQGPEVHELTFENGRVRILCSPAMDIMLSTAGRSAQHKRAEPGALLEEAEFDVSAEDRYFRLDVVDSSGRRANTRAYFLDELE